MDKQGNNNTTPTSPKAIPPATPESQRVIKQVSTEFEQALRNLAQK